MDNQQIQKDYECIADNLDECESERFASWLSVHARNGKLHEVAEIVREWKAWEVKREVIYE